MSVKDHELTTYSGQSQCGQDVVSWFSKDMHLDNYEIEKIGENFNVYVCQT